ncbi:DUSP5, partial [Cervus elaphus hippelaphus]
PRHRPHTHSHKTLRCRRNPRLLRQRVARPGAERTGRERRVERPLRRRARSAGRSPVGSSSWASPAGTLAVGTCRAHGAGPLGGGMKGSRHWQKLREESAARVVLTSLLACLPAGPRVYFLKGGYETFYSEYPECCVDVKPISQEKVETERALISQCGKSVLNISYRPAYDQGGPVEILPFLYLGSAYHASKCEFLANLHITALLNVSRRTSEACTTHLHYKWIPVEDSHAADISSHFQEAIDFIDCVREKGGKVLVHCEAGISRSPTICMAYLMKTKQFHLKDAFDYIKQRRSVVSPNFGFMGQLLQYESEILPSTPTPQAPSCQGEAAGPSLLAHLQTLSPDVQASYCTFPTSVLAPVPTHSTASELSRSPLATATSC